MSLNDDLASRMRQRRRSRLVRATVILLTLPMATSAARDSAAPDALVIALASVTALAVFPIILRRPTATLMLLSVAWALTALLPWRRLPLLCALALAALIVRALIAYQRIWSLIFKALVASVVLLAGMAPLPFPLATTVLAMLGMAGALGMLLLPSDSRAHHGRRSSLRAARVRRSVIWGAPAIILLMVVLDVAPPRPVLLFAALAPLALLGGAWIGRMPRLGRIRATIDPAQGVAARPPSVAAVIPTSPFAAAAAAGAQPIAPADHADQRLLVMIARVLHDVRRAVRDLHHAALLPDAGQVRRQAEYLRRLADMALHYLVQRAEPMHCHAVTLADLVDDALGAFRPSALARRVHLVSLPDATVVAWADPVALRRVLDNLLANALDATLPGGVITVRMGRDLTDHPPMALLEVRDTGSGIAAELLPHIFTPFVSGGNGVGLGLTIVADLIEAMHGTISVASAPGMGSVFTIRLPLATGASTADHPADDAMLGHGGNHPAPGATPQTAPSTARSDSQSESDAPHADPHWHSRRTGAAAPAAARREPRAVSASRGSPVDAPIPPDHPADS